MNKWLYNQISSTGTLKELTSLQVFSRPWENSGYDKGPCNIEYQIFDMEMKDNLDEALMAQWNAFSSSAVIRTEQITT